MSRLNINATNQNGPILFSSLIGQKRLILTTKGFCQALIWCHVFPFPRFARTRLFPVRTARAISWTFDEEIEEFGMSQATSLENNRASLNEPPLASLSLFRQQPTRTQWPTCLIPHALYHERWLSLYRKQFCWGFLWQKLAYYILSFEKKLPHPANSICLFIYVTFKRIELEGPGWSGLVKFWIFYKTWPTGAF